MSRFIVEAKGVTVPLAEMDCVVEACRFSRASPGTWVTKIEADGRRVAMSRPAPKEKKR